MSLPFLLSIVTGFEIPKALGWLMMGGSTWMVFANMDHIVKMEEIKQKYPEIFT